MRTIKATITVTNVVAKFYDKTKPEGEAIIEKSFKIEGNKPFKRVVKFLEKMGKEFDLVPCDVVVYDVTKEKYEATVSDFLSVAKIIDDEEE